MTWGALGSAAIAYVASQRGVHGGGPANMADPFASQRPQYAAMLQYMMTGRKPTMLDASGVPHNSISNAVTGNLPSWQVPSDTPSVGNYQGVGMTSDGVPGREGFVGPLQGSSNNSFMSSDPSYEWRLQQGLEGVNRKMAAGGFLSSGNRMAELMNYGQNTASTEFQNEFSRLSQLSGANIGSPAAAAQLQQQQSAAAAAGQQQLLSNVGTAVSDWWKTDTGSGGSVNSDGATPVFTPYNHD